MSPPTLTGAQPAAYTSNGKTVRALAQENDRAFALLNALDANQRKRAVLNYEVHDLVLGPGHAGETIQPEGLKASDVNERHRAILLDVISEWAGLVSQAYAMPRMAEIKAGLDDTYFAWSGPATHKPGRNGSAHYRRRRCPAQSHEPRLPYAPDSLFTSLRNDYSHARNSQPVRAADKWAKCGRSRPSLVSYSYWR